jgi:hypothetical protein
MLAPDTRTLLLDALRPPLGMRLDRAVATTFTLDLATALTVPLALAGFNLSGTPDVVAVMESLRSQADRLDIFAQAGMISASTWPGDLAALIEDSIHTVGRPRPGHLFHPKIWVLRFVAPEEDEVRYRCLVSSRNLTGDRSWDVMLRLDSDPEHTKVNADNDQLVRLFESLADMPGANLTPARREGIAQLASDLRRVWWQMPDGVDRVRFLAFGIRGGYRARDLGPLFRGYRHLLISPFVTAEGVQTLLGDSTETELTIVSRADQLDSMEPSDLADTDLYTINPLAGLSENEPSVADDTTHMLGDLHAKVFVIEANRRAFVYLGSANATAAAFNGNVELMCELTGSTKALGVHTMLNDTAPFRTLLEEYEPPATPIVDLQREAGRKLEAYLVDAAATQFTVTIQSGGGDFVPTVSTSVALPKPPAAVSATLHVAPFNRRAELVPVEPTQPLRATLAARPAADLTAFLILSAVAIVDGIKVERSVIVRATLVGAPSSRLDDVLIRQLDTPEKFLQFLMLLLSLGGDVPTGIDASLTSVGSISSRPAQGLLELMVRALAVHPEALDRLAGIVEHLEETGHSQSILPDGWRDVWSAISQARALVQREAQR